MTLWLKLAYKEVKNNARFSLFFIVNLTLGLVGFIALDSFKASIQGHLEQNSRVILTADFSVRSNQPFSKEELDLVASSIGVDYEKAEQIRFFSMVAGEKHSRLVRIIGLDQNYPLYGRIVLTDQGNIKESNARQELLSDNKVWVAKDLILGLDVVHGDGLKIGSPSFEIVDSIVEDPTSATSTFSGLPTVYMGIEQLRSTGLIQPGSRVQYEHFYRIPADTDLDPIIETLQNKLNEKYPGSPKIRVQTHTEASQQLGRVLGYLNDYLGLVALIALFLAGVGAAYLFRSFLTSRFKEMAILMSLGATQKDAFRLTLLQIILLGFCSSVIASFLAYIMLPLLPMLLEGFLPNGFESEMGLSSFLLALFMGTVGSVISCLPILARVYKLNPVALFHENVFPTSESGGHWLRVSVSYLPSVAVYWGLAVWQAHSWIVGSLFVGLFLGATLILGMIAWGVLAICGRFSNGRRVNSKIALRNLYRNKTGAISCFLAIGLGALLINLIPQIQKGLQDEISKPDDVKVPSFFLFDIQPEQVDSLKTFLTEENYNLSYLTPMIRARLEAVNGETFSRQDEQEATTREQEQERRSRNRGFNLSYREGLADSERMVAGKPFSPNYDWESGEPPEISLEDRFADRLGIEIGDLLTFDVQSVPIEGKVVNFRKVKWNSFQPNFFIVFQPGALEEAPTTFLAGITNVNASQKNELQNGVVQRFPNISLIDVSRVVSRILDITDQISWAIRAMAYLSILAGLVVLFSIAQYEIHQRFWEINLLKVLGARFKDVRSIVQIEFGILGFFAAIFGVLLSNGMSLAIAYVVFESIWSFSWPVTFLSVIGISALSMLTALAATYQVLRQKPLELLRST